MEHRTFYEYVISGGTRLFTAVFLPCEGGKFPTVIYRSPYVDAEEQLSEQEICERRLRDSEPWLNAGYAVVLQHCRGRGRSDGDCIPYINEREDTLALYAWIREQSFYNGELYPVGHSYLSSVHFVASPFPSDIKGAILEGQDSERYNCNYRNGFYKMGLHGGWYIGMYKKKSGLKKSYTQDSYRTLPLSDFSKNVLGESAPDFDGILRHPDKDDEFWSTRYGGGEAHDAIKHAGIPILLVTGFYDIYTGGIFDMWNSLDESTRSLSALAVHPYNHGGSPDGEPIAFEGGRLSDAFENYKVRWLDSVRGVGEPPFERGKVTYYKLFGDRWCTDDFRDTPEMRRFRLGDGCVSYKYNPYAPASFAGGLSTNFGGNAWQYPPSSRYDIITLYTPEFPEDTYVKGKMRARLSVSSDCEDTCFYVRVSLCKSDGDYGLRDDINQISNFDKEYCGGTLEMDFSFDEHAFVIGRGERLRIDISSSAYPHYVPHTNVRGLYCEQRTARVATNTVALDDSYIDIPVCEASGT